MWLSFHYIGWGALTEGGSSPSNLYKVDVPYVDDETCNRQYGGSVAESMICYGEAGKVVSFFKMFSYFIVFFFLMMYPWTFPRILAKEVF